MPKRAFAALFTLLILLLMLTFSGHLIAQQVEPTPGAINIPTETATFTPTPRATLTPGTPITQQPLTPTRGAIIAATPTPTATSPADDPRLAICRAPQQPGFLPHIVRAGDRLETLLAGHTGLTVTQIAALNCIDDPSALPIGAVIWLPAPALEPFTPQDADPTVDDARILSFSALPQTPQNTGGVAFTWEAVGTAAYLYLCPADSTFDCARTNATPPLPTSGLLQINGFAHAGDYVYRLEVVDGAAAVTQDITISVSCAYEALVESTRCPDQAPLAVFAVYQPFERGAMLYFSDTAEIYVLTEDGRIQVFADRFEEGLEATTEATLEAPDGLFAPIRGFGLVWHNIGAENALGWATAEEGGIDALRQPAGRQSYTTYVRIRDNLTYAFTVLPGTSDGYWALVGE